MPRRTLLFAGATVLALLATGSLYIYVSSLDNQAIANAKPVNVLVATKLIPAGTTATAASSSGSLTLTSIPRKAVPDGALSSITPITGLTAVSDIFPGEMILRVKFSEHQTTGALSIPGDKIAVSVELGDPERVAGFVVPGSDVAIFDTYQESQTGGAQPQAGTQSTRLLLERVSVIAVGPVTLRAASGAGSTDKANNTAVASTVLTLAVSARDAEKLVQATQTGKLYFGLLSSRSATAGATQGVDNRNLFS